MNQALYNIRKKNVPISFRNDLYYTLMKMSWGKLVLFFLGVYLILNLSFALLYFFIPGAITGDQKFSNAFFFSVQTLSTVGYGSISPANTFGNIVSVVEMFIGMLSMALMTGLIFSKFSLPKDQIVFTNKALLTTLNGERTLMFRLANARSNRIMNAQIDFTMLKDEVTKEGIELRRFEELKLRKSKTPFFSLSLIGMHVVDETSPLYNMTDEQIKSSSIEFVVSLLGHDDTYGQTIHATKMYQAHELVCGGRFADILFRDKDGSRLIDFKDFNKIY